jgi:hypothetical protein
VVADRKTASERWPGLASGAWWFGVESFLSIPLPALETLDAPLCRRTNVMAVAASSDGAGGRGYGVTRPVDTGRPTPS